uniref:CYCLIN domain-containing protein n=2 Tax=Strongyloides stercoralis TaxID=6248 RepID=A0AAF5I0W2_STRER
IMSMLDSRIIAGLQSRFKKHDRNMWIFTEEELANVPSIKDGMSAQEVLNCRIRTANYITQMMIMLNKKATGVKRITQLCTCIAITHMHRFYTLHSFKHFNMIDVAASCLYLACKTEDCYRKISYVIHAWWKIKYPNEQPPDEKDDSFIQSKKLIEMIENLLLKSVNFDMQLLIPHYVVLRVCQSCKVDRNVISAAYFYVMDMIHLTDWAVRYSDDTLACLGCHLAISHAIGDGDERLKSTIMEVDPCEYIIKNSNNTISRSLISTLANKFLLFLEDNKDKMTFRRHLRFREKRDTGCYTKNQAIAT